MIFMPSQILGWWLRVIVTIAALVAGISLIMTSRIPLTEQRPRPAVDRDGDEVRNEKTQVESRHQVKGNGPDSDAKQRDSSLGWNRETASLVGGIALVIWSLLGGWFSTALVRPHDPKFPENAPKGNVQRLDRPDGSKIHVEVFGNPDGVPVVLTHGWGLDGREWLRTQQDLESRCRIIVWDLPGLGRSKGPSNKDWSLEKLATDLRAVSQLAGAGPAIFAGHSIGGMIILTFCRLFPDELSHRVAGIVLGQTTYKNPVETTSMAAFYRAIQEPVLKPLCWLMIGFSPLAWLMNWWSYCNGSVHRTNHRSFFSGSESREELRFISRYSVQSSPAVVARGLLAMFHFDSRPVLGHISVPTVVIAGERDTTCLPQASEQMIDRIPSARGFRLKNAEHGGVFEFHQRFSEAIHELISTTQSDQERRQNEHESNPSTGFPAPT